MTRPTAARTTTAQVGHARAMELRLEFATSMREARRDAGLSVRQLATAAKVGQSTIAELEAAGRDPGLEVLARVSAALGGRLRMWSEPGTGPNIHDRHQGLMLGALLRDAHEAWKATLEVEVRSPALGFIDTVLERRRPHDLVAVEAESGLRRIEQQVRWAQAKADALAVARGDGVTVAVVSRLLLLRSTTSTRAIAATFRDVLAAAYPAPMAEALAALRSPLPWPGAAIIWCETTSTGASLLDAPPRGLLLGR